mmetsp:Transcript_34521/g.80888  ORF Transcript_34521/g.80888 Transcript_34521/m.80888 type:complete len:226 (+) Transcript_34521:961-1638(+)
MSESHTHRSSISGRSGTARTRRRASPCSCSGTRTCSSTRRPLSLECVSASAGWRGEAQTSSNCKMRQRATGCAPIASQPFLAMRIAAGGRGPIPMATSTSLRKLPTSIWCSSSTMNFRGRIFENVRCGRAGAVLCVRMGRSDQFRNGSIPPTNTTTPPSLRLLGPRKLGCRRKGRPRLGSGEEMAVREALPPRRVRGASGLDILWSTRRARGPHYGFRDTRVTCS